MSAQSLVAASIAAAKAYCEYLWDRTHSEHEASTYLDTFNTLLSEIRDIDYVANNLSPGQITEIRDCKDYIRTEIARYASFIPVQKDNDQVEQNLWSRYVDAMHARGLHPFSKPEFFARPFDIIQRLKIQKRYDVEREVIMMTHDGSIHDHDDIEELRNEPMRQVYEGCVLIPEHLQILEETNEVLEFGPKEHIREILPAYVASLIAVDTAGRPKQGEWKWERHYRQLGYRPSEDFYYGGHVDDVYTPEYEYEYGPQPVPWRAIRRGAQGPVQPPVVPGPVNANPNNHPQSRHGRPVPYMPTRQAPAASGLPKTKFNDERGNPPGDVSARDWDLAFNRADSRGRSDGKDRQAERRNGMTRDAAIDQLIRDNILPQGFQDVNP